MKKAFDANVSRAKPRLRLGAMISVTEEKPEAAVQTDVVEAAAPAPVEMTAELEAPVVPDLAAAVRAKAEKARAPKPTAAEAVQRALDTVAHEMVEQIAMNVAQEPP